MSQAAPTLTPPPPHDQTPLDHRADGPPMTQDEIDTHWLTHVYKPNEPQLTPRAVITGMLLGGVMSLSNLYVGLKSGWGLAVTVTAAVLAFGIFSSLKRALPYGPFRREFTSLENNTMASSASAAGYFTGAGLTSAIPALTMATGRVLLWWELALWILAVSFLGVLIAVPMRRQMIDIDRLPFPEGLAYAETIRSLHAAPGEARKKAMALLYGALAGASMKLLGGISGLLKPFRAVLESPLIPEHLPTSQRLLALTLGFQTDILFIGAGAMMGLRIGAGLFIGAIVSFGVLASWLESHGLAGASATFGTVRTWLVWPGVSIIVVNGLLAFALKWRTALAALRGVGRLATGGKAGGMAAVEVPTSWFAGGLVAATVFVVVLGRALFDIPIWMGLLATALSTLLSIVACRATGETSITPIGALGKITQFMYGGLAAGNIQTNLMTASITAGAAMHSADLLTDLKGGYILGAKPRNQFLAQFFGICMGAVFCIPAYQLLATPENLGSTKFPAPAAKTWQAVAELLAGGVHQVARGDAGAAAYSASLVPVGAKIAAASPGSVVRIDEGPNAGRYELVGVVGDAFLLHPALPVPQPPKPDTFVLVAAGPEGLEVARVTAKPAKPLHFLTLAPLPAGTVKGDYLRADLGGHEVWWSVKEKFSTGLDGIVAVDRPFDDPRTHAPIPAGLHLDVRKESLPPGALVAVIVAALLAALLTLVEAYAPARIRQWIPSTTGLGLGFVVAGFDSISMFLGALIAWAVRKWKPDFAENYTLAGASGIMAGASLAGILIIALATFGVIAVP